VVEDLLAKAERPLPELTELSFSFEISPQALKGADSEAAAKRLAGAGLPEDFGMFGRITSEPFRFGSMAVASETRHGLKRLARHRLIHNQRVVQIDQNRSQGHR
jgi:hypothetical protein